MRKFRINFFQKYTNQIVQAAVNAVLAIVQPKLNELEYRSFNRRYYAIEQTAEYLVGAEIEGDYCEFGVYKGATFIHAYKSMSLLFRSMRFFAFDSFGGLPEPKGLDAKDGYSSSFKKNDFAFSQKDFEKNLHKEKVNFKKITIVPGWFKDTLCHDLGKKINLKKIAVAWIDCDLYESAVPVLNFITPFLVPGSVVVFDDWHCFRNNPKYGVQKACREWLKRNPKIKLNELFSFGWNGEVFTVERC